MNATKALFFLPLTVLLTGCGGPALPTFNEVRSETRTQMQAIVDQIPATALLRVDDPRPDAKYHCTDESVQYTGQWQAYVSDSFDVATWMNGLRPSLVAEGYRQVEALPPNDRSFSLMAPNADVLIGVDNDDSASQGKRILIHGDSACAKPPA